MKESWLTWEFCLLSALQKRQLPCHHEVVQTVVKQTNKQTRKKYIYYSSSVLIPVFFQTFSFFSIQNIIFSKSLFYGLDTTFSQDIHSFLHYIFSLSFFSCLSGEQNLFVHGIWKLLHDQYTSIIMWISYTACLNSTPTFCLPQTNLAKLEGSHHLGKSKYCLPEYWTEEKKHASISASEIKLAFLNQKIKVNETS